MFGVPFLQAGKSEFLLILESSPYGWDWTSELSRFPGWGNLCLSSFGWSWISSLWSSEFGGVYGFGMAFGSPSFNFQGCVPVFLKNKCGASYTGTFWLGAWFQASVGGTWFQCRFGDFWVGSCLLMFPGVRSSLTF